MRKRFPCFSPPTPSTARIHSEIPIATGTGAIEYWATMTEAGKEVTLAGGQMLAFDDAGRCTELREYWHTTGGHAGPPPGWGN